MQTIFGKHEKEVSYNVYIPYNKFACKGVIKLVDLEFDINKYIKEIETNIEGCDIIEARRLSRRQMSKQVISQQPQCALRFRGRQYLQKYLFLD